MSDSEKKYVTFRDLRTAAPPASTLVPESSSTLVPDQPKGLNESTTIFPAESGTRVPEYQTPLVPESKFYRKPNAASDKMDRHLTGAESKVLDHLLRLTVGFNTDRRQIRVEVLRERTGYRAAKTVRVALFGLESKGIIKKISRHNDPLGDEYVILNSGTRVLEDLSTQVESTLVLESKTTRQLKTDLKDKSIDDETAPLRTSGTAEESAFTGLFEVLKTANIEITGKSTGPVDQDRWRELGEVLKAELLIAAARTTVSNVPAFLAEHLRRRLWKLDKRGTEGKASPDRPLPASETHPADCRCGSTGFWYPAGQDGGVARCTAYVARGSK